LHGLIKKEVHGGDTMSHSRRVTSALATPLCTMHCTKSCVIIHPYKFYCMMLCDLGLFLPMTRFYYCNEVFAILVVSNLWA